MRSYPLTILAALLIAAPNARAQTLQGRPVSDAVLMPPVLRDLCKHSVRTREEGAALGRAILAYVDSSTSDIARFSIRAEPARLGVAAASFHADGVTGVITIADSTNGNVLLHEITHAMLYRMPADAAQREVDRILRADSLRLLDDDLVDRARYSFTLGFTGLADTQLWGVVPFVLGNALQTDTGGDRNGKLAQLIRVSDDVARKLHGFGGERTVADAYNRAADNHWKFARTRRPRWWSWQHERTFLLVSEVLAYQSTIGCPSPNRFAGAEE